MRVGFIPLENCKKRMSLHRGLFFVGLRAFFSTT